MAREYSRREFLRKAVVGMAAGSVLAACQPKVVEKVVKETVEVEKVIKETVVVEGAAPAPKEPVPIRFHARIGEQENKLYEMQMPKFMEANPHITIELENFPGAEYITKVTTMHAGGTLGDVCWGAIGNPSSTFSTARTWCVPSTIWSRPTVSISASTMRGASRR